MNIWQDLGISGGTALIVLFVLYFIIKWAVKNGIISAYKSITGKETAEDIKTKLIMEEMESKSEKNEKSRSENVEEF